jgi:hypothetical protein
VNFLFDRISIGNGYLCIKIKATARDAGGLMQNETSSFNGAGEEAETKKFFDGITG